MASKLARVGWVVVVLALAAGLGAWAWWGGYVHTYQAQQQVRAAMLDPDSARFANVKYHQRTRNTCGYVNGRNRMGGYTGNTPFILLSDGEVRFGPQAPDASGLQARLEQVEANIAFLKQIALFCPEDGPPVPEN